ncbi:hypothetical protein ABIB82_005427 [Bradyrhizobium sp. i1.8.4]|uniref:hypothetical protein n=1 Tax=unclassified Bradyrhizobium TaxID=2631580 RepID=UPI003D1EBCE6
MAKGRLARHPQERPPRAIAVAKAGFTGNFVRRNFVHRMTAQAPPVRDATI